MARCTDTRCVHVQILHGAAQFAELVADGLRHEADLSAVWKANWEAADVDGLITEVKVFFSSPHHDLLPLYNLIMSVQEAVHW